MAEEEVETAPPVRLEGDAFRAGLSGVIAAATGGCFAYAKLTVNEAGINEVAEDPTVYKHLRIVNLDSNEFASLQGFVDAAPQLSVLSAKGNKLTSFSSQSTAEDAGESCLQILDLSGNALAEAALPNAPAVRRIALAGNQLQSLEGLKGDRAVELDVSSNPPLTSLVSQLPALKKMVASNNEALATLEGVPETVEELVCAGCTALTGLATLPTGLEKLRTLNVGVGETADVAGSLDHLASAAPNLERLTFTGAGVDAAGVDLVVEGIRRMPGLKEVNGAPVTDEDRERAAAIPAAAEGEAEGE